MARAATGSAEAFGEVLIEVVTKGAWRRVSAIDPVTRQEAIVHGPSGGAEAPLVKLAIRRLERQTQNARA